MRTSLNQRMAMVAGVLLLIIGGAGFVVTGLGDFAAQQTGKNLLIFQLNPLHNIVHILMGSALLIASRIPLTARTTNAVIGTILLFLGVLGLFIANTTSEVNVLALNQADNGLHLALAIMLVGTAMTERVVSPQY